MFPDHVVCLEEGKKLKMLKRHLKTSDNTTAAEYCANWRLPNDYPMAAPSYAAMRPGLAKKIGLGRKPSGDPEVTQVPAQRARSSKG